MPKTVVPGWDSPGGQIRPVPIVCVTATTADARRGLVPQHNATEHGRQDPSAGPEKEMHHG